MNGYDKPLSPPDMNRCQADVPNDAGPFTVGGVPGHNRCTHRPRHVAYETHDGSDGRCGCMSLCGRCMDKLVEQQGLYSVDIIEIEQSVAWLWNMSCPSCGRDDKLHVDVVVTALLSADGTDAEGDHEWSDASGCSCRNCGWAGTVEETKIVEPADSQKPDGRAI